MADVIVASQTPAGGWSKNQPRTGPAPARPALRGQQRLQVPGRRRLRHAARPAAGTIVGTLDNDATITELRFPARVAGQLAAAASRAPPGGPASCAASACWPPSSRTAAGPRSGTLEGGHHDAITYNDDAVTEAALPADRCRQGPGRLRLRPGRSPRKQAGAAAEHAVACVLATQVVVGGKRTIWAPAARRPDPQAGRGPQLRKPASYRPRKAPTCQAYLMSCPIRRRPWSRRCTPAPTTWPPIAIHDQAWTGGRDTAGGRRLDAPAGRRPAVGPLLRRHQHPGVRRSRQDHP